MIHALCRLDLHNLNGISFGRKLTVYAPNILIIEQRTRPNGGNNGICVLGSNLEAGSINRHIQFFTATARHGGCAWAGTDKNQRTTEEPTDACRFAKIYMCIHAHNTHILIPTKPDPFTQGLISLGPTCIDGIHTTRRVFGLLPVTFRIISHCTDSGQACGCQREDDIGARERV